jgi:hypothetical protein
MPLTTKQSHLLHALEASGGSIKSEQLPHAWKAMGTKMARDGLTKWTAPGFTQRWNTRGQILHITDAGRAALRPHN